MENKVGILYFFIEPSELFQPLQQLVFHFKNMIKNNEVCSPIYFYLCIVYWGVSVPVSFFFFKK